MPAAFRAGAKADLPLTPSEHFLSQTRDWRLYVRDMIEFAEQAVGYAEGLDQLAFTSDRRTYDATLRNIELIGEAATHEA